MDFGVVLGVEAQRRQEALQLGQADHGEASDARAGCDGSAMIGNMAVISPASAADFAIVSAGSLRTVQ